MAGVDTLALGMLAEQPDIPGADGGYGYGGYGRPCNPGRLGGSYSGLGVRPGLGFGGFGLGR
jgi:hypothetical protein